MALQMKVKTNYGIEIDSYIKIDKLEGGKEGFLMYVNAYNIVGNEKKPIMTMKPNINISPINKSNRKTDYYFIPDLTVPKDFIAQGYTYLKTLPEFSTAKDN